jgi:hypothetical protein
MSRCSSAARGYAGRKAKPPSGTRPAAERRRKNSARPARCFQPRWYSRPARYAWQVAASTPVAPIARTNQRGMHPERLGHRNVAAGDPDGEDERQAGPVLPFGPQVVGVGIMGRRVADAIPASRGLQQQRGVADHQPRGVRIGAEPRDIGQLGVGRDELGSGAPDLFEEEPQQFDARQRRPAHQHPPAAEFAGRHTAVEHDAADGAVGGDPQIRQQQVALGVAGVLHRAHDADVERALGHLPVERRRHPAHQRPGQRYHPAVDRPVDGVSVDVLNAADAHHHRNIRGRRGIPSTRGGVRRREDLDRPSRASPLPRAGRQQPDVSRRRPQRRRPQ